MRFETAFECRLTCRMEAVACVAATMGLHLNSGRKRPAQETHTKGSFLTISQCTLCRRFTFRGAESATAPPVRVTETAVDSPEEKAEESVVVVPVALVREVWAEW